jgi:nucleotide-binding universal stress UspA family protein
MKFADILVCIDHTANGKSRMALAMTLAGRSDARLVGYYLAPRHNQVVAGVFGSVVADFVDPPQSPATENAALDFERELKLHDLNGTWILGDHANAVHDIAKHSRCVDLLVVGLGDLDDTGAEENVVDIEKVVIECGRPVLGIPITATPEDLGTNILVAWDGSREASRAVHDALPFLREAKAVYIVSLNRDQAATASAHEAVSHLRRTGIAATIDDQLDLHLPVGEEILSRIERNAIDLLVAGAFGHSRLIEHIVGGASRSLLHQMMVPVLVSH